MLDDVDFNGEQCGWYVSWHSGIREQMKFRANSGFRKLTSDAAGAGAKIS